MKPGRTALLLCAAVLALSCSPSGRTPKNVLLLSVDTLRADALGAYGNAAARTPVLDALAGSGVLFEQVLSQAPATGPSFSSILTSLYPEQHGTVFSTERLSDENTTLAEILRDHGMRTGAFVSCSILRSRYGFAQGFDEFDETFTRRYDKVQVERSAEEVTRAAAEWLGKGDGRPFFLWIHYFDPHAPYETHGEEGLDGKLGETDALDRLSAERSALKLNRALPGIRKLYAAEVSYVDHYAGELLSALERLGHREDTLVVLAADHGEELFDHHWMHGHYKSLSQSVLHVPLVFSYPRSLPSGRRISAPVENVDILPTILSLLGLRSPAGISGRDLLGAMRGESELAPRPVWAQREPYAVMPGGNAYALRNGDWKLIRLQKAPPELYDLSKDPGEKKNLASQDPDRTSRMQAMLEAWPGYGGDRGYAEPSRLDGDRAENLRSLGYLR